jgi:hypothetical protein
MNICPECFDNPALKRRLTELRPKFPSSEKCRFHPTRKAVPLEEAGKIIEPALRANYAIGEWMYDHQEGDDLRTVVNETTGADDDTVIYALIAWLLENDDYWPPDGGEPFFADDQTYVTVRLDGRHSGRAQPNLRRYLSRRT